MRMIGRLAQERMARRLADHLLANGIPSQVDPSSESEDWIVWVVEEDDVERAGTILREFLADPEAEVYRRAEREAGKLRAQEARKVAETTKRVVDVRKQWYRAQLGSPPIVTGALLLLSLAVAAASRLGSVPEALRPFTIAAYEVTGNMIRWLPGLPEVRAGQVWRLVTPILIHFGALHLLFNMMWLVDLGWKVERRRGSLYMLWLVLLLAIPSNLAQYLAGGPSFGGMSGVVFGLVGYVWARNRFARGMEYPVPPQTMTLMLIWFVVCVLGLVGPIANWAHGVGLVTGGVWGWAMATWQRRRRRP
jgi:GlpG protein